MSESVSNRRSRAQAVLPASSSPSPALRKKPNGMWDDSAMLDDIATISYEQALRSHRRVPPVAALCETNPNPHCLTRFRKRLPSLQAKSANPPASPFASRRLKRLNCTNAPQPLNSPSPPTFAHAFLKRNLYAPKLRKLSSSAPPMKPILHQLSPHRFRTICPNAPCGQVTGWRARTGLLTC